MEKQILIGTGAISWLRSERVGDRYGAVAMFNENSQYEKITDNAKLIVDEIKKHEGRKGKLVCEVIEIRDSTHIGDFFHGFIPKTPKKGAKIELGEGTLFFEHSHGFDTVGLKPDDGRDTFWLQPKKLYNVHEQTVNLFFIPN